MWDSVSSDADATLVFLECICVPAVFCLRDYFLGVPISLMVARKLGNKSQNNELTRSIDVSRVPACHVCHLHHLELLELAFGTLLR